MSAVESQLKKLWKAAIGTTDVSSHDDFLRSGGTSLGAVLLAAEIQDEFGVAVDAIEIVEERTFEKIAAIIEARVNA